ncbi:peptidase U32 [Sporanaerobium hydrogeniformans]|uniref:Peptidase U32 n=1 Tax=Sporanaerobium hydrogeniformans TaxID=3072179 RepID=A0AC61DBM6_9FIRM|nr:U32 family peptidase [Sporanaerobium hydrogeniformans]PHV70635.1 peptidase U32 [Sporanaerobium hydrogeniformans]
MTKHQFKHQNKVELLCPAGSLETLKIAVLYGADAVYIGGDHYSLRAKAKNFTPEEMAEGIRFAHENGVLVYVTANIFAHDDDFNGMADYFRSLEAMGADALIIADPGVFSVAREAVPNMEIHISTQANNTNAQSALFWANLGAERIVTARELSFEEIKKIHDKLPKGVVIESFVHGAMCMSYSGRCLLSNYMASRDANRGECAQPCRWKYHVVEETRPGEYMPIEETERGTYIYNSRDLCMIEFISELIQAGVYSFKIEGRMKTPLYVATVTKAYRDAIDTYLKDPALYEAQKAKFYEEVGKASHREFTSGFYEHKPTSQDQTYTHNSYVRNYDFSGMIVGYDKATQTVTVEQRRKFSVGETVEILRPQGDVLSFVIDEMWNEAGESIESAPHPKQLVTFKVPEQVPVPSILRKWGNK